MQKFSLKRLLRRQKSGDGGVRDGEAAAHAVAAAAAASAAVVVTVEEAPAAGANNLESEEDLRECTCGEEEILLNEPATVAEVSETLDVSEEVVETVAPGDAGAGDGDVVRGHPEQPELQSLLSSSMAVEDVDFVLVWSCSRSDHLTAKTKVSYMLVLRSTNHRM